MHCEDAVRATGPLKGPKAGANRGISGTEPLSLDELLAIASRIIREKGRHCVTARDSDLLRLVGAESDPALGTAPDADHVFSAMLTVSRENETLISEMALINYFKPQYNELHKSRDTAQNERVERVLASAGYDTVVVELILDVAMGSLGTPQSKPMALIPGPIRSSTLSADSHAEFHTAAGDAA